MASFQIQFPSGVHDPDAKLEDEIYCFLSKRVIAIEGADMNDVTSRDERNKKTRPFCNKFNTRT